MGNFRYHVRRWTTSTFNQLSKYAYYAWDTIGSQFEARLPLAGKDRQGRPSTDLRPIQTELQWTFFVVGYIAGQNFQLILQTWITFTMNLRHFSLKPFTTASTTLPSASSSRADPNGRSVPPSTSARVSYKNRLPLCHYIDSFIFGEIFISKARPALIPTGSIRTC
ncbi:hypothetical protein DFP72DRAFT_1171260 [Ephemerocybe angulata]|uniref:Uncharacterized protein n=1 Tax=Ephemerocybe angulata TaxID=980116 RepID=A0A8H6HWJ8_9AGAR|nr:hypothetical protein DFP72DRAFT_1171260 [Tulosesus angulatus]